MFLFFIEEEILSLEEVNLSRVTEKAPPEEEAKRSFRTKITAVLIRTTLVIFIVVMMTSLVLVVHQQAEEGEMLLPLTVIKKSSWTTLSVDHITNSKSNEEESIPKNVYLDSFFTQQCGSDSGCTQFLQRIEIEPTVKKANFLISNHGTVFEDLGWTKTGNFVILFLGDETNFPSAASLKAIDDLLTSGVENGDLDKNFENQR